MRRAKSASPAGFLRRLHDFLAHWPLFLLEGRAKPAQPVTDLYDEYNLSDGNVSHRAVSSFKGSPFAFRRQPEVLSQSSPPSPMRARIKTPTLLLHDTGDARVTITQSYQLYHALKENGVPVKFFAYPVAGHFPGDFPVRQMDVDRRWVDWMDQYLK